MNISEKNHVLTKKIGFFSFRLLNLLLIKKQNTNS